MNSFRVKGQSGGGDGAGGVWEGMGTGPHSYKMRNQDFLGLYLKKDNDIKNKTLFEK